MIAVSHMRSFVTGAPDRSRSLPSGGYGARRASVPYFMAIPACSVSMMPTAATTLASTGAVRSGREPPTLHHRHRVRRRP